MRNYILKDGILTAYIGHNAHAVIPKDVTEIGDCAFADCDKLTTIKIPNSVTRIGEYAFDGCKNLTSIKIPNSVKYIGVCAFGGCFNLTNIEIPNSVTYIDECAFDCIKNVKPQYTNGKLRAFKAFNYDWTCRDFQYKIGESFHQDGKIKCCWKGFHACPNPLEVFNHYDGELSGLRFAEVELSGNMDWDDDKVAASDIKIVRELSVSELAKIYNSMEKENE